MEENSLIGETHSCQHHPKIIRYTIDIGLGHIKFLELCQACRILSNLNHVIKTEVIENG